METPQNVPQSKKATKKGENSGNVMSPKEKKEFLNDINKTHVKLSRRQREYKKVLSFRLQTRAEQMLERSYITAIKRLRKERNDLRAQIWVAEGRAHRQENKRFLEFIECQIKCQDRLSEQVKLLKVRIRNMENQIGRVGKQIYDLNRKTIPDTQHQGYVANARKRLNILENRLEVGVKRECDFSTKNAELKDEMETLLGHRAHFSRLYTKMVQSLNADKKYLMDLLEYACNAFESAINLNEKLVNTKSKFQREREQAKMEMQSIMRHYAAAELIGGFTNCKGQVRDIADLQPKEYRRRNKYKHFHLHRIGLYNSVLGQLFEYTNSYNVDAVIENYQQHESLYYSYFSVANELSFRITLIDTALQRLFKNVTKNKSYNRRKEAEQREKLIDLDATLTHCRKRNEDLNTKLLGKDKHLENLFHGIAAIFNMCRADATPLMKMLGNNAFIDVFNARGFFKLLEKRILNILRNVYVKERENEMKSYGHYVVQELEKIKEEPTALQDIVLTQQCAECAEGEAINVDDIVDAGGEVKVLTIDEVRMALHEKVNQPEMQYRLHNISQCRLPRSRLIAANRNN